MLRGRSRYLPVKELAVHYLLGFGDKCECIEPEAMRNKMLEVSKKLYQMYC